MCFRLQWADMENAIGVGDIVWVHEPIGLKTNHVGIVMKVKANKYSVLYRGLLKDVLKLYVWKARINGNI